jgi:biotin carboxylase
MSAEKKTVIMIGGGIQEVKAIKIAQDSGYKVLVTDRSINSPCFQYADYFAVIDGRDIESLIAYTMINKKKLNITGVFTLTELVTSVAAVATAAELPSVTLSAAVSCQNKQLCKEIWYNNNVSTPKGRVVTSFSDAKVFFSELNHKAFVKPTVGFGGVSSQKITSQDDLKEFFININQEIIMEELLEGSMHDVNGVIDNYGTFHPMGIVDRFFMDDFPVEQKTSTPSCLNYDEQVELYKLLESAVKVLGINWGPVKGDAVFVDGKFSMLEVAPRLHGPKSSVYLLPYSGLNCLSMTLDVINGAETIYTKNINQEQYCICSAVLPEPGKHFNIESIENKKNIEGIKEVLILNKDSSVIDEYKNSTDVPAYIFAIGKDIEECNVNLIKTQLFAMKD